jgi:hypothetical protein
MAAPHLGQELNSAELIWFKGPFDCLSSVDMAIRFLQRGCAIYGGFKTDITPRGAAMLRSI